MIDKIEHIVEVALENKLCTQEKQLRRLLRYCIYTVEDSIEEKGEELADITFHTIKFFKELPKTLNGIKQSELYSKAADLICLILNTFDVDVTKEECFILFHFRENGKFRTKEHLAFEELKSEWGLHKSYAMDEPDFLEAVRDLKNHGLINHRRGTVTLVEVTVFRYKMVL